MIRKGNNKFKTLHKGSELVTRVYKGDELIYQDYDAIYSFKFTIDTRKNMNGGNTASDKGFGFKFLDLWKDYGGFDPVSVDWGDGNVETINPPSPMPNQFTVSASHTYDTAGVYQIKILPTVFENGFPKAGWLSGLDFNITVGSSSSQFKMLSYDKPLPENSYNVYMGSNSRRSTDKPPRTTSRPLSFTNLRNFKSAPSNLFSNIKIIPHSLVGPSPTNFSLGSASYCGYNITAANFNCDLPAILKVYMDKLDPDVMATVTQYSQTFDSLFKCSHIKSSIEGLFDNVRTTNATNLFNMFNEMCCQPRSVYSGFTIPEDLFEHIDTSHATTCTKIFCKTFYSVLNGESVTIPDRLFPLNYSSATTVASLFEGTFGNIPNATDVAIPEHIFDGLKIPLATDLTNLFSGTFSGWKKTNSPIPSSLFANVTLTSSNVNAGRMFNDTFANYAEESTVTNLTIPSQLFASLPTIHATNTSSMFAGTFSSSFKQSTVCTIPSGLFNFVDMTNTTSTTEMFSNTFYLCARNSTVADIPSGLFDFLDTSSCTNFTQLFNRTFLYYGEKSTVGGIPSGLFAHLDMSSCTNAYSLFQETFGQYSTANTSATIPANLFSTLNLSTATDVRALFQGTFYSYGKSSTIGTIPSGLFDHIAAPLAKSNTSMFYNTFHSVFHDSTAFTIPSGLFSHLDMTSVIYAGSTSNGMFRETFAEVGTKSQAFTIPSDLFSAVDLSNVSDCSGVFGYTFDGAGYMAPYGSTNPMTIPATLFQNIDTSSATKTDYMFSGTFRDAAVAEIPQGLLGNITVAPSHVKMFESMFSSRRKDTSGGKVAPTILSDLFDGMSDFSWAVATDSTSNSPLYAMFNIQSNVWSSDPANNNVVLFLIGSASTVLQHFNFNPNNRLQTFANQKALTDYETINTNWK